MWKSSYFFPHRCRPSIRPVSQDVFDKAQPGSEIMVSMELFQGKPFFNGSAWFLWGPFYQKWFNGTVSMVSPRKIVHIHSWWKGNHGEIIWKNRGSLLIISDLRRFWPITVIIVTCGYSWLLMVTHDCSWLLMVTHGLLVTVNHVYEISAQYKIMVIHIMFKYD